MPRKELAPRTFKVIYEPDGTGWHVRIPDVQGCHSWGRGLAEARRNIREALSTCEDVFGADVDRIARDAAFEEVMKISSSTMSAVQSYKRTQEKVADLASMAQVFAKSAAVALVESEGVSLRDAGEFLGLSRERVRELAKAQPVKRPSEKPRALKKKVAHAE